MTKQPTRQSSLAAGRRRTISPVEPGDRPSRDWSDEEVLALARAKEHLVGLQAIYAGLLDEMSRRGDASAERLAWLRAEIASLGKQARTLQISDHERIAWIQRVYGALLKGSRGVW